MSKHHRNPCSCKKRCDSGRCHKKKSKCKREIKWPPSYPDDQYGHIPVPGCYKGHFFKNINQAINAIDSAQQKHDPQPGQEVDEECNYDSIYNPFGYVIHLAPTQSHYYSGDMTNDIKFLRIEGDVNPVKGVGYFDGLGNWGDYPRFNNQYNVCIGGVGPFEVSVNCNVIKVKGCRNPVYDSLECGDKLTFFHKSGKCTIHTIKKAWENYIKVCEPIPVCGCVKKGEGFVVRPNVNLKMCPKHDSSQKFQIEHRMEFAGLNLELSTMLIWGCTGGQTEMEFSVIEGDCGSLVHVGTMDWYKPNTFLTNFTINSGSHGTAMLQTFVGCKANLVAQSNPFVQFWFGVFVRNQTSVSLINGGQIDTFSSDYCDSNIGTMVQAGSKHAICKCRFLDCDTATYAEQNSHLSALPMFGEVDNMAVEFLNNELAIKVDTNSHHALLKTIIVGNTVDLDIDGTAIPNINDYASGTLLPMNSKNSVVYYAIAISSL